VALVRKRTIPTKRPPLVGEVGAKLCPSCEDKTEDKSPSDTQVCGNSVTDGNIFLREKILIKIKNKIVMTSQPDLFKRLIHLLLMSWPEKGN
jgi:hypothetical protein